MLVIVFFSIFAIIILTEVLMIDDKNKAQSYATGGGTGSASNSYSPRQNSYSRFGESIPDYEEVKDEYSIEDAVFKGHRVNRFSLGEFIFLWLNFRSSFFTISIFSNPTKCYRYYKPRYFKHSHLDYVGLGATTKP